MNIIIERFKEVDSIPNVIAFFDVSFDGKLIITDCKIMDGANGKWVALPAKKANDGKWYPIVKFATEKDKTEFDETIFRLATAKMR